jgi:hypothetical protein
MTQPRSPSQLQGSAGDWNALGGSYSHSAQSSNRSFPLTLPCEQNLRPLRIKFLLACRTHWDRTRKCTSIMLFSCQSHTEDSKADRTMPVIAKKRKALIVCDCQTEYHMLAYTVRSGSITLGIQTLASS